MKHEDELSGTGSPLAFLSVVLTLTWIVLLWSAWQTYDSYRDSKMAMQQRVRIDELRGLVVHLDEVLTMSARMAAATGDMQWEERYRRFEPQLDAAIKEAMELAPKAYGGEAAAETDAANVALVEMENRAFDMVREGRPDEARALLFSDEYETQKQIYADGMSVFGRGLSEVIVMQMRREKRRALFSGAEVFLLFPFLVIGWLAVFRSVGRWRAMLMRSNRSLIQRSKDLADLNRSLDRQVAERTAELSKANESLRTEIAERKRVGAALGDSLERLKGFDQHSTEGIYRVDIAEPARVDLPRAEMVHWINMHAAVGEANDSLARMYGLEPRDMIGRPATDFAPDYGERAVLVLEKEGYRVTNEETEDVDKDGNTLYLLENYHGIVEGEYLVSIWGAQSNITERKRAEKAKRESDERLRQIAETIEDVFWITDWQHHRTLFASPAYETIWGRSLQDLYADARNWAHAIHPEDRENAWSTFVALGEGTAYDEEYRIVRPDGSVRWIRDRGFPVRDASGQVYRVAGIAQDITERKRAEEEKLALERQVQHAQKLESLGVLAGGIAHDFNNILMAVRGYAELAVEDLAETHPALSSVREIEKGAKRAAELTRQMLAYSGRGRFVIEAMDASALMDDMAHLLRTSIPRTIVLNLHLERSLPAIEADASQVQQVVMNLITNAADAIGDEDGAIALSTGTMDVSTDYLARNLAAAPSPEDAIQPGAYVFFEVSDTGCGMDEETRAKLFEPFFSTKFTGRGLGMAAVQGIVRGHKGAIVLDTEPGKGSTFRVLLPVVEGESVGAAKVKSEVSETGDWPEQGTILVVDDEAQIRKLMQLVLERKGFTVLTAEDGRHAADVFREHRDDIICVLLDLTMPHMGGEETYSELRQIREDVQVILVSGYSEEELKERVENLGFAGFLKKPVGSAMLLEKVRSVLNLTEGM